MPKVGQPSQRASRRPSPTTITYRSASTSSTDSGYSTSSPAAQCLANLVFLPQQRQHPMAAYGQPGPSHLPAPPVTTSFLPRPPSPLRTADGSIVLGPVDDSGDHIKRPANSFLLFRSELVRLCKAEPSMRGQPQAVVSKLASTLWHELPQDAKDYYDRLQGVAKARHEAMYPNYKFRPRTAAEKEAAKEAKKAAKEAEREAKKAAQRASRGSAAHQAAIDRRVDPTTGLPLDPIMYSPPMSLAPSPTLSAAGVPDDVPPLATPLPAPLPMTAAEPFDVVAAIERLGTIASTSTEPSPSTTPADDLGADVWQNPDLPAGPGDLTLWPTTFDPVDTTLLGGAIDWNNIVFDQPPPGELDVTVEPVPPPASTSATSGFLDGTTAPTFDDVNLFNPDYWETTIQALDLQMSATGSGDAALPQSTAAVTNGGLPSIPTQFGSLLDALNRALPAMPVASSSAAQLDAVPPPSLPPIDAPADANDLIASFLNFDAPGGYGVRDRFASDATITPAVAEVEVVGTSAVPAPAIDPAMLQPSASTPAVYDAVAADLQFADYSFVTPPAQQRPSRSPTSRPGTPQSRQSSGTYTLSGMLDPFASPPRAVDKGKGKSGADMDGAVVAEDEAAAAARTEEPYAPPAGATRTGMRRAAATWRDVPP